MKEYDISIKINNRDYIPEQEFEIICNSVYEICRGQDVLVTGNDGSIFFHFEKEGTSLEDIAKELLQVLKDNDPLDQVQEDIEEIPCALSMYATLNEWKSAQDMKNHVLNLIKELKENKK